MANSDPNRALLSANCHGIMHFQKLLKTHLAGVERLQSAGDFLRGSPKVTSLPRITSGSSSPELLSTLKITSFSWAAKIRWRKLPLFCWN